MGAAQTVSQAYLLGIGEGRAFWRQLERDGIADLEHARQALAKVESLLGQSFAGEMRDAYKGERDFWRQRIKRLAEARAMAGEAA